MRFMEKMEQTPAFKSRGIKIEMHSPLCEGNTESPRLGFNKEFFALQLNKRFNIKVSNK